MDAIWLFLGVVVILIFHCLVTSKYIKVDPGDADGSGTRFYSDDD